MTNTNSAQLTPIIVHTRVNQAIQDALASLERPLLLAQRIESLEKLQSDTQAALVILDNIEHCSALHGTITAPILLISDEIDAALAAGATDCVSMHPTLLVRRVQNLLETQSYSTYDFIPAMIHSMDRDGTLIYVNAQWLEVLGYSREEVIAQPIFNFMSETSRRVAPRLFKSFWETGLRRQVAIRFIKKNGDALDVLVDSNPVGEAHNLTVLRDISELKSAEQSLRNSRTELQAILRVLPDSVIVANRQGGISQIISEADHPHISDIGDLQGKTLHDTLPQNIAHTLLNLIDKTLTSNRIQQSEYDIDVDEMPGAYLATASPLNADEVVIVLRDIIEQRFAEASLRESEKNYRRLFENATDAIFVIDVMTGKILQASPQASLLLGYSRSELLMKKIDEIESDHISIREESVSHISSTDKLTVETQYRRFDGRVIDVEVSSRVILEGKSLVLISFVRDVSDRNRALEEMERQRNLAEALLDTANVLNESPDLDAVLDKILANVSRIIPRESANIMIIEDDAAHIIRHLGYEDGGFSDEDISKIVLPLNEAHNLRWIAEHKKALRIDDTQNSELFEWVDTTTSRYVRSLLTAPIITNAEVIGFINLDSTQVRNFSKEQEYQLTAFANQVAIGMQQASLLEKLRHYTDTLEKRVSERTQELRNANAELEQAQTQLADERNLLRLIIDTIPDSIYVKDTNNRFLMANKATVNNLQGIETEADLIGKTDGEFYPEIAERLRREESQIVARGQAQINQSEVYQNADGTVAHLLITKLPLIDSNGKVTGIIGVNHDLTQLRQTEARLEQVVKSARCLLWTATVVRDEEMSDEFTWEYKVVNEEAAQDFLPLDYREAYTSAWLAAIPPSEQAKRNAIFQQHITASLRDYRLEYFMILQGVEKHWLSEDVLIEKVAENRWHLVGVCTDITTRKEAEEQLKNLNDELELRVATRTLELSNANQRLTAEVEEREKAEAAERQQRIIAEAIRDSVAKLSSSLDRDAVFDHILSSIGVIVPNEASNIMLVDGDDVVVVRASEYQDDIMGLRYSMNDIADFARIIQDRKPLLIADVNTYEAWHDTDKNQWIRSHLGVPIHLDDEVIGFINIDSAEPNRFTEEQGKWMMTFGDQAGIAIRNARYTAELEQRVKERTQELEFEQAQLKAILNGVTDGVVYTDMERIPQYVNRALVDISGFGEKEWIDGSAQAEMNIAPVNHLNDVWDRILRWLETNPVWTGETQFRRKDGSLFSAAMVRTTVNNQQGETVGIVTVLRDVSDEKHLQEQKARFITTAAHELRTPIANLKTRLFLMKRRPEKFDEHIRVAEAVVNLMQNLVEHMFDLSRFERGIMEISRESLKLQEFLREVLQFQQPQADRLDIAFKLNMPEEPIMLNADPFRLTQVITNLIGNALKYTPSNSEIQIAVRVEDKMALIEVSDSGEGIAAEHIPNLFQPFYQVSSDNKGAGLGLAIVYEIIKAHGGDVTVESELHQGTTFHVRLPIIQTELESV